MCARDPELAKAAVGVAKTFGVAFMGLAGTQHQVAAKELGVPFLAEWFAGKSLSELRQYCTVEIAPDRRISLDLEYTPEGELIITKSVRPLRFS